MSFNLINFLIYEMKKMGNSVDKIKIKHNQMTIYIVPWIDFVYLLIVVNLNMMA